MAENRIERQLSVATRRELINAIADRYRPANRIEKKKILDEFIEVTRFHPGLRPRRTRADPFEKAWTLVEDWRNDHSDATAKGIFLRLHAHMPDTFAPPPPGFGVSIPSQDHRPSPAVIARVASQRRPILCGGLDQCAKAKSTAKSKAKIGPATAIKFGNIST